MSEKIKRYTVFNTEIYDDDFGGACGQLDEEKVCLSSDVSILESELEAVKKERDKLKELVVWIEDNVYRHSKVTQKCRSILGK